MSTLLEWVVFLIALTPLYVVAGMAIAAGARWLQGRRRRRIEQIEAELDRTAMELRETILRLASELGAEAHEARKQMIQASFVAAHQPPDRP